MKIPKFDSERVKSSQQGDSSIRLQEVIDKQEKEITLWNRISLILDLDYKKSIDMLLLELLDFFIDDSFSSLRMVVKHKNHKFGGFDISGGIGENNQRYAYLDEQVLNQLGQSGILYIQDTTKIHSIKFFPGSQFPRSVLGFSLGKGTAAIGMIWFAAENRKDFTKHESESLILLSEACASVLKRSISWRENLLESSLYLSAINIVEFPLIITAKDSIIFSNQSAGTKFGKNLESPTGVETLLSKLWEINDSDNQFLSINNRDYHIKFEEINDGVYGLIRIMLLIDDTVIKKQNSYISFLFNSISQSLRSPLNLVRGAIKMVPLVGELNDHQKTYLANMNEKIDDTLELIEELLNLERLIESHGLKIQEIECGNLFKLSCNLVVHLAKQKRITINNVSSGTRSLLLVDTVLFTQALANIFEYAIGQTGIGEEIIFTCDSNQEGTVIEIQDHGNGLSQVEVEKFNSDNFFGEIPSSLRTARRIIGFHSGNLFIESQLGSGNKYCLRIPKST